MGKLTSLWSQEKIDVIAAIAGLLLGIVISCLNFIYSNAYLITIGPLLAAACLLYLVFHRKWLLARQYPEANRRLFLVAGIIFFISFAVATYSLHTGFLHRPVVYFILTAVAASMIAVQILCYRNKSAVYLILFEILLLSLSVTASAYWVFPSLPGVDTWFHREYIRTFVEHGGIPDSSALPQVIGEYYLHFPIMHLSAAAIKLVGGISYKAAMFLGVSLPTMLSSLFVFLIARSLANTRVGLLAILLFSLNSYFLNYCIAPIPNSFGVALFAMVLYLLIRNTVPRVVFVFLTILLLMVLIITHTLSSFVMLSFLLALLVGIYGYRLIRKERAAAEMNIVTPALVGLFGAAMLSYWIYEAYLGGGSFFNTMASALFRETTVEAGFGQYELTMSGGGQILNILGFLVLLFFGVLGCLLWLSREYLSKTKTGLIATLIVLLGMPLGLAAFGIEALVPDRWFAFSYVVLTMVAAVAMLTVTSHLGYRWLGNISLIGIVFVGSFFMISNKISNADSPIYTPELIRRLAYTNAEQAMAEKIVAVYDDIIVTDLDYEITVIKAYLGRIHDLDYRMLDGEYLSSGLVLWRNVMAERPVRVPSSIVLGEGFQQELDSSCHLVYTNNDGKAYLAR